MAGIGDRSVLRRAMRARRESLEAFLRAKKASASVPQPFLVLAGKQGHWSATPQPGRGCWQWPAEAGSRTVLGRPDQEERSFPHSFDTCPRCQRAAPSTWQHRPFPGDSCCLRNSSGHSCPAVLPGLSVLQVSMGADGLSRWRSTVRRACARRGKLGIPARVRRRGAIGRTRGPRCRARRGLRRMAAHRSGPGRCPGERDG